MSTPMQIWVCAAHHPAFRCGGWASVRADRGQVVGAAGGERNTTAARMALAGLVSALRGLPASHDQESIRIQTTSPDLASLTAVLAGRARPDEDLDLWAQIATASKTHHLDVVRVSLDPDTPTAFATAWANLAMDKAKATGPFTAAIPKANLAKAPGLA
jgi:ribonuclease HI